VLDGATQLQAQPAILSVEKELFGIHYAGYAGLDAVEKRNR
jgi:hypothetical protein